MGYSIRLTNAESQGNYSFNALHIFAAMPHDMRMAKGHFLKEWRRYRGLTQEGLAERLEWLAQDPRFINDKNVQSMGKTQGNISKLENGTQRYDQVTLEMLAEIYGTDPGSLIMRNPLDQQAVYSVWDSIPKERREQALRVLMTFMDGGTTNAA